MAFSSAKASRDSGSDETAASAAPRRSRLRRFIESFSSMSLLRFEWSLFRRGRPALPEHAHEIAAKDLADFFVTESAFAKRRGQHREVVDPLEAFSVHRVER